MSQSDLNKSTDSKRSFKKFKSPMDIIKKSYVPDINSSYSKLNTSGLNDSMNKNNSFTLERTPSNRSLKKYELPSKIKNYRGDQSNDSRDYTPQKYNNKNNILAGVERKTNIVDTKYKPTKNADIKYKKYEKLPKPEEQLYVPNLDKYRQENLEPQPNTTYDKYNYTNDSQVSSNYPNLNESPIPQNRSNLRSTDMQFVSQEIKDIINEYKPREGYQAMEKPPNQAYTYESTSFTYKKPQNTQQPQEIILEKPNLYDPPTQYEKYVPYTEKVEVVAKKPEKQKVVQFIEKQESTSEQLHPLVQKTGISQIKEKKLLRKQCCKHDQIQESESHNSIKEQTYVHVDHLCDAIIHQCQQAGQRFVDMDFYPNGKHIGEDEFIRRSFWERASKFMKNPVIFEDGIEASDICQNELGDCYLLASLAALCEWPQLIKNLFILKRFDEWGIIAVSICWKGVWQEIILDEYFPIYKDEKAPIFSSCIGDELWVLSLEKAWAKLHGSYWRIDGGFAKEPLHDFSGAPSKKYIPAVGKDQNDKNNSKIWKLLKVGETKNHAMCAGSIFFDDQDEYEEGQEFEKTTGLINGHIYTLISVINLRMSGGSKIKIVKLRNPWGDHEWIGDFSDKDPIWNTISDIQKKNIGFSKEANDGIFFMKYNDLLKYFDEVTICYQYPLLNFSYDGIPFDISHNKVHFFQITIELTGIYYFQVCQRTLRVLDSELSEDPKVARNFYSEIYMAIYHSQTNKKILQVSGKYREVCDWEYVENPNFMIEEGEYYAYVRVEESSYQKDDKVYGFGSYGCSKAIIEEISEKQCKEFAKQMDNLKDYQFEFLR